MTNKVLIGVPTLFPYIHTSFWKSWMKLAKPKNHAIMVASGTITSVARNNIVDQAQKLKCSHVMFLDSDMTFPQDAIQKLIELDKDITVGLYFQRDPPHLPTSFTLNNKGRLTKEQTMSGEVFEISAAGTGCMLIKTEIFDKMKFPWFDYQVYESNARSYSTEDIIFCRKATALGYKIYVDTSIKCGHIIDYEILEKDYKGGP